MAQKKNAKGSVKKDSKPQSASRNGKKGGGHSFFTWFMVLALLGVWTSVAVVWFDLVDYDDVLGKLGAYDADGDGDFDVDDAKVLLGLKEKPSVVVESEAGPETLAEEPEPAEEEPAVLEEVDDQAEPEGEEEPGEEETAASEEAPEGEEDEIPDEQDVEEAQVDSEPEVAEAEGDTESDDDAAVPLPEDSHSEGDADDAIDTVGEIVEEVPPAETAAETQEDSMPEESQFTEEADDLDQEELLEVDQGEEEPAPAHDQPVEEVLGEPVQAEGRHQDAPTDT